MHHRAAPERNACPCRYGLLGYPAGRAGKPPKRPYTVMSAVLAMAGFDLSRLSSDVLFAHALLAFAFPFIFNWFLTLGNWRSFVVCLLFQIGPGMPVSFRGRGGTAIWFLGAEMSDLGLRGVAVVHLRCV